MLSAVGVQYSSLGPPTLHATTLADLALLTIVPPQPTQFSGEAIFCTLDQHLSRWMPSFVSEIQPDGILRFKNLNSTTVFVPRTLTLPSSTGVGTTGVRWPSVRASSARAATRLILRGGSQTAAALLSTVDGTLKEAWSSGDQSAWTLKVFTQPGDAKNVGAITSVTANTATIDPTDNALTWASNFWPGREGIIYLINTVTSGFAMTEMRIITANTALTAGGTSVITWDASQPLDNSGYNNYRIVASAGGLNEVGRLYNVREPHTGAVGLSTYIGAHLVVKSPIPIKWANNTKSVEIYYATGIVVGGSLAIETPLGVEVLPGSGQFRFIQPVVLPNGATSTLNTGYPTTVAGGLPIDVQILALYSRGINESIVPADSAGPVANYQGTAYTVQGMQITRLIDVPAYTNQWDAAAMAALGQQHLDAIKDTVYEGTGEILGEPTWDIFDFNYAFNYAIAGTTSPWSAINAPVRRVTLLFPQGEGVMHKTQFQFSTTRRPFSGDDLYLHPSFTGGSVMNNFGGDIGLSRLAGSTGFVTAGQGEPAQDEEIDPGKFLRQGAVGRPAYDGEVRRRENRQAVKQRNEEHRQERREAAPQEMRAEELARQWKDEGEREAAGEKIPAKPLTNQEREERAAKVREAMREKELDRQGEERRRQALADLGKGF
jgi:hypothetical protein